VVFVSYAEFDELREIDGTTINTSYQLVGDVFSVNPRIIGVSNSTDVDLYVSFNGDTNNLRVAAGSFKLYDVQANKSISGDNLIPQKMGVWVKESDGGTPTMGWFWVEALYSRSG
jgi:hypothetical protein